MKVEVGAKVRTYWFEDATSDGQGGSYTRIRQNVGGAWVESDEIFWDALDTHPEEAAVLERLRAATSEEWTASCYPGIGPESDDPEGEDEEEVCE
jgi:hypothetical protein